MFFVRGLTSAHREVLINPEQVVYVRRIGRKKSALVMAHSSGRLIVDQDPPMVEQLFEEFFKGFGDGSGLS
jgi:hypothetical protein